MQGYSFKITWPLCWWGGGKIPSPLSSSLLTFHHQSECAQMKRNKEVSRRNKKMKNSNLPHNLCHALSPLWESLQGWGKLCQSPENVSLSGHCRDKSRKDLRPQDFFPQFWKAPEQKDQLGYVNRYQKSPSYWAPVVCQGSWCFVHACLLLNKQYFFIRSECTKLVPEEMKTVQKESTNWYVWRSFLLSGRKTTSTSLH